MLVPFSLECGMEQYADMVRRVAQEIGDERASKCGYDLLMGLVEGNARGRLKSWEIYLKEHERNDGHTETERNGVWVPAL